MAGDARAPRRALLAAVAVAAASAVPFLSSAGSGFLAWDDADTLVRNRFVRGVTAENVAWMFTTFHKGPYQPLSWLSFAIEHEIHGLDPGLVHLANVLLHAANAALVFFLALAVARARGGPRASLLFPAAAALLFGLHPLRVESVAWATERRDVLSTFFFLGSVLLYLRHDRDRSRRALVLSVAAFVLSLLAKAWGVTLPVVLVLADALLLSRWGGERGGRLLLEKIPFAVPAALIAAAAIAGQQSAGTMSGLAEHGVFDRAAQCGYSLAFYASRTAFPFRLTPLRELPAGGTAGDPLVLAGAFAALAAAAVVLVLRRRAPLTLLALASFAILVSPVSGLAQAGTQLVADRYSYGPGIPLALLAGAALDRLAGRTSFRAVAPAVALALVLLAALSERTTRLWQSDLRLFERAVAVDPEGGVSRFNRGMAKRSAGDDAGAEADFGEAIRLLPRFPSARLNRGNVRLARGDFEGAAEDYTAVIESGAGSTARALWYRGKARSSLGDLSGALEDIEAALVLEPGDPAIEEDLALLKDALRDE